MASLSEIIAKARGGTQERAGAAKPIPEPQRIVPCPDCGSTAILRDPDGHEWVCFGCRLRDGPALPTFAVMDRDGWQIVATRL